MTMATWLADVLRAAGCEVVERPGWQTRGRPGSMGNIRGVILHHTGSNPKGGFHPALGMIEEGRPDLPGPLSHLLLARDGIFHVVAAGLCNHAGRGFWQGVSDGNHSFIGIEAENNGVDELWPRHQMDEYGRGVAAILKHLSEDAEMAVGHKEWAQPRGRKVDPTFDMQDFRRQVESLLDGSPASFGGLARVDPVHAMLKQGDRGESVKELQELLKVEPVSGFFGPITDSAVRAFQKAKGLKVDGKVGPKTWSELGV